MSRPADPRRGEVNVRGGEPKSVRDAYDRQCRDRQAAAPKPAQPAPDSDKS